MLFFVETWQFTSLMLIKKYYLKEFIDHYVLVDF